MNRILKRLSSVLLALCLLVIFGASSYMAVMAEEAPADDGSTVAPMALLPAPNSLYVWATGATSLQVVWGKVDGAEGYNIYRAAASDGEYTFVAAADGNTTSYEDTGLAPRKLWFYKVAAAAGNSNGELAGPVAATTLGATPLAAPANLRASGDGAALLEWDAVTGATGYTIYRSATADGSYTVIGTVEGAASYTDTTNLSGVGYYKVASYQVLGGTHVEGAATAPVGWQSGAAAVLLAPAAAVQGNSIVISWTAVPGAQTYQVYRAVETAPNDFKPVYTDATATSFTDTDVTAGATYSYKVSVTRNGAEEAPEGPISVTLAGVLQKPAAPTGVTAVSPGGTVTVSWETVANVDGYILYRSTDPNGNYQKVDDIPGGTTASYVNTDVVPGVTYYYKLTAVLGGMESDMSDYASVTTKPGQPAGMMTVADGQHGIKVSWDAVPYADEYVLARSDSFDGTYQEIYSGTNLDFTDSGLQPDTTYYYIVHAVANGVAGNNSGPVEGKTGQHEVEMPRTLTATATGSTTIRVDWSTVANADGYKLYWSLSPAPSSFQLLQTFTSGSTSSFLHTGLTPNTTYYYMISATRSSTESSKAGPAWATTWPEQVQNLVATATGSTTIRLDWQAVNGATGYRIYRSLSMGGPFLPITDVGAVVTHEDQGLTPNTTYYYQVSALRGTVEGLKSNIAYATTWDDIWLWVTATSKCSVRLDWIPRQGATGYRIYRSTTGPNGTFKLQATVGRINTWNQKCLCPNTTYWYYLVPLYSGGATGPRSNIAFDTTFPCCVCCLCVKSSTATTADLKWKPVSGGAAHYNIYRSETGSKGPFVLAGTSNTNTYTDTGLKPYTTYYYYVTAVNNGGHEGARSNVACERTKDSVDTPQNFTATPGYRSVQLSWQAVSGATYQIYRSTDGSRFTRIESVGRTTFAYNNRSLRTGTTYWYYVVAVRNGVQSLASPVVYAVAQ